MTYAADAFDEIREAMERIQAEEKRGALPIQEMAKRAAREREPKLDYGLLAGLVSFESARLMATCWRESRSFSPAETAQIFRLPARLA